MLELPQSVLGCLLLTLLLGVAMTLTRGYALNKDRGDEDGGVTLLLTLLHELELYVKLTLLAPLQKTALEVLLLSGSLVEVEVMAKDLPLHEMEASLIASVHIECSHQSLEGVAWQIIVVGMARRGGGQGSDEKLVKPHLECYPPKSLTPDYLAARVGEEAFWFVLEVAVDDVCHYGIEDGISKELEPLVGEPMAVASGVRSCGLVEEGQTIGGEVEGTVAKDAAQRTAQLPVTAEGV